MIPLRIRAWQWRRTIINSQLPPTTRHVLLTLSCFMSEAGDSCFPSQATLAAKTGLSERSIRSHLRNALKAGWLERRRRGLSGLKRRQYKYLAVCPESAFVPDGSAARIGAESPSLPFPEVPERVAASEPEGDSDYQSSTEPLKVSTPQTPLAVGSPILKQQEEFERLKRDYPSRKHGNLRHAWRAFTKLPPGERDRLIKATPDAARHYTRRKKGRIPALATFIRSGLHRDFVDCPPIDGDGNFVITPDRPEWKPWLGRLESRYSRAALREAILRRKEWHAPERWPPGYSPCPGNTGKADAEERDLPCTARR